MRWLDPPPGPWTVERAYAYCEEFARAHTESYPVASRFVPPELRPHLVALYAFARSADDFADEPEYEGRRVEALDRWEEALRRCCHGEADHPVFVALADTIEKRDLPIPPLEDMLTAFRMDLDVKRYATFAALRGYTARSAEPVGRLLLALFGYRDPELVRYADEMSTALQLTNFWQDVAGDAARDHIYIPAEDLHFFGVTEADVKALKPEKALRDLMRFEVARTRALYERAARCSKAAQRSAPGADADLAGRHHHPRQDRGRRLRRVHPAPRDPPPRSGGDHGPRRQGMGDAPGSQGAQGALAVGARGVGQGCRDRPACRL